jgi:predicted ATPase
MTLNLQNVDAAIRNLKQCDTHSFRNIDDSFRYFTNELKVNTFRHISNLTVDFDHPVTIISGNNKIGKTSLLLLLACSHENFIKIDSTTPKPNVRPHGWGDVLSFTSHENVDVDYSYELKWRVGLKEHSGEGKRLASSKAWSGLGKKSSDSKRINAKIRDRIVRLIDLERILPGRSFTRALYKKANLANETRLAPDIEQSFAFIFDLTEVKIFEVGGHINKNCFLIVENDQSYSSYNAASGEESIIYLLKDIIESPNDSLILIDEVEAGFHPSVQRKLAEIIQYISWKDKKQFVITTHSPTMLSSFPSKSRRFIEQTNSGFRSIREISRQAARSKMDSKGYPLVQLYCEDALTSYLVNQALIRLSQNHPHAQRLVNVVKSGPINQVKNDYE